MCKRHLIVCAGLLFLSLGILSCSSPSGGNLEKSSEGTYGIDYEHPELYLAAGPQSEFSAAHFAEVAADLEIERIDLLAIGRLYRWKASHFEHVSVGGG